MWIAKKNGNIIVADINKDRFQETISHMTDIEVEETTQNVVVLDNQLFIEDSEEYKEKLKEIEHNRIQGLFMTRSDFFDGIIMAFNLGQAELRTIIEQILNGLNITDVEIKVALNNYDNALNFYRKHTLFTLLNNVEIPINEDMILIFTDSIWDKFFDTKDYKELQKAIQK